MKAYLLLFLCIIFTSSLMAVTVTWNGGSGLWNDPNNWSTNTIPDLTSEVIIANGKVSIPANFLAHALSVTVEASSKFSVYGVLELRDGLDINAIENYGIFTNYGRIYIINYDANLTTGGVGIVNENKFTNKPGSLIRISNVKRDGIKNTADGNFTNSGTVIMTAGLLNDGIENWGSFTHQGDLIIENVGASAIVNESAATFENNSTIAITAPMDMGIRNFGDLTNNTNGEITINQAGSDGINLSNSILTNAGEINITGSFRHGFYASDATFLNEDNGFLYIEETGENGIYNFNGNFQNHGDIEIIDNIGNDGIYSNGSFITYSGSTIHIEDVGSTGFSNAGSFMQQGNLIIRHTTGRGIYNSDQMTNRGRISIRYADSQGFYHTSGTFNNRGLLVIRDVTTGAGLLLSSETVHNFAGASIQVRDVDFIGIQIMPAVNHFINEGNIAVVRPGSTGLSCSGNLENQESGNISLTDCDDTGMALSLGGTVTNSGNLTITLTLYASLSIPFGDFFNENGGSISINGSNDAGLFIGTTGTFTNDNSTVSINQPIITSGISNGGTINNVNCASISTQGNISNIFNGTILNEAWIYSSYNGINSSLTALINNGGIGDYHGSLSNSGIQNNSVLADTLSGNLQVGVPYPNALNVGSLIYIKPGDWYTDANGSTLAGNYDYNNNTFTPNSNSIGLNELYVKMWHNDDGCSYLFPIQTTNSISPIVAPHPTGIDIAANQEEPTVEVFPNPTSGDIQLKPLKILEGNYQIRLFDTHGRVQYQTEAQLYSGETHRMNLPTQLTPTLYLLQISNTNGEISNQRLIVQ